ncbi:3-oxoacyl-[acyl-carrier-protein] reductase FabG [Aquimixticola soesokkakensis]|uniref:3-oxoacyl-[acyl-carrier-protein] reductase FabG n=1 Tax=Aquimixticola soesokkakensis TaxID=1519096 RepID=A0A1Y5TPH3_9RHOB|nr:SDR family oxidoreductase [Aquimixticola soesokkakensis]SLN66918.1 3-oxoacyl-[acyl-carrier-protein] reductase FabG [Aquimixticola soesokkakensis]
MASQIAHQGKALITGAGTRLGRAMALALGQRGFDVAVHYGHSEAAAEEVVRALQAMGVRAGALQADLLSERETQTLVARAQETLGGALTLLVNNASIFEHDDINSATRDSWDRAMESNLRAPFVLTQDFAAQAQAPVQDEAGEPVARALVVNMLDQRVRKLTPEFMSYTLAKMGLWAFTQTGARALAPKVRINAIGPGPTLQGANQTSDAFANQRAKTVLQRGSNPADIVAALMYFIDAPAVTGQLLCTDGGQHLAWQTPELGDRD